MTRLRAILNDIAAFVRGEPILSAALFGIAGDIAAQFAFGDGMQGGDLVRIVAVAVLSALGRAKVTPTANPLIRALPTDPPSPAEPKPVITLSGRR